MICPHRPACPGCPLADLDYPAQLARKRARVAAAFAAYPHLPAAPEVLPSAWPEGYRHRLKLPVAIGDEGHAAIGLYDERGTRIVDTPECPVLEPHLREALGKVRAWVRGKKGVHSVDLRRSAATGQLQMVLACVDGQVPGGRKAFAPLVAGLPELTSIAISKADRDRKRVMGSAPEVVWGKPILDEEIGQTRYHLHPGAFFQVDPRQAEKLHALVYAAVGDAATILDLYSGVGAYALMLAPGRKRVVAVEEVPQAARAAAEMAPRNVEVVTSKVEDLRVKEPFDVVVLNPARRGSDPRVLAQVAALGKRLVYVSCGPETLARDLDCLAAFGMRVRNVQPIDLFPQTPEVETVVTLERGPALREWRIPGGQARSPWGEEPSGAVGKAERALVLFLGATPAHGEVAGARFKRIATVAGHSLVRLELSGQLVPALLAFARKGHGVAGREPKTARFFAEKAGLVRPFIHVEVAGQARAPLHGDLVAALEALGAPAAVVARAGGGRSEG